MDLSAIRIRTLARWLDLRGILREMVRPLFVVGGIYYENGVFNNVLFDRPGRLSQGLFFGQALPCPSGVIRVGSTAITSVNGVDIATGVCGQRVGDVATLVQAMETAYQAATTAAGAQSNPNFVGETLANGADSTGNNFFCSGYRTPRSYQMNLGIQREIRPGTVVTADFIRNIGERYLLAVDSNHVGDARYLNKNAALNAIATTTSAFGCSGTNSVCDSVRHLRRCDDR